MSKSSLHPISTLDTYLSAMLLSLFLALVAAPPLGAQQTKTQQATAFDGLVEVSEVLLDVLVTDADGAVVTGLGREDFVVEEDGREVELTGVSFYTTRYADQGPDDETAPATPGEVPTSRYFIFFFHDQARLGSGGAAGFAERIRDLTEAGHQAQTWIETEMRPSDWLAVASFDSKLKLHQDFTQDRDLLVGAVAAATSHQKVEEIPRSWRASPFSISRHLPSSPLELEQRSGDVWGALGLLADASAYFIGRKNLLLFSRGLLAGEAELARAPRPPQLDKLEPLLNDANVAVYPVHLRPTGIGQAQGRLFDMLADGTGGLYYENFREFSAPLREIGAESYAYYVVSYASQHPAGEIGYERLRVTTRDPSLKVRARRGYRYGL